MEITCLDLYREVIIAAGTQMALGQLNFAFLWGR